MKHLISSDGHRTNAIQRARIRDKWIDCDDEEQAPQDQVSFETRDTHRMVTEIYCISEIFATFAGMMILGFFLLGIYIRVSRYFHP